MALLIKQIFLRDQYVHALLHKQTYVLPVIYSKVMPTLRPASRNTAASMQVISCPSDLHSFPPSADSPFYISVVLRLPWP